MNCRRFHASLRREKLYEKLYENALFEPTRFHTAMNLYENGGLFVFNGLHGRFPIVSYSFIQTEYIYENMKLPIGLSVFQHGTNLVGISGNG